MSSGYRVRPCGVRIATSTPYVPCLPLARCNWFVLQPRRLHVEETVTGVNLTSSAISANVQSHFTEFPACHIRKSLAACVIVLWCIGLPSPGLRIARLLTECLRLSSALVWRPCAGLPWRALSGPSYQVSLTCSLLCSVYLRVIGLNDCPKQDAWINASVAGCPTAKRVVPVPGCSPRVPSGRSNLILGATNKIACAKGANSCHHGAEVLSGNNAIPHPCLKNFPSHCRLVDWWPNGGFIHTIPNHSWSSALSLKYLSAGTWRGPSGGQATSKLNETPKASKI